MTREELLRIPEYWTTKIQLELYAHIEAYMLENNINRTELAKVLGVSKGYVTQILNGDYDHRLSKLVEISLKINYVPHILYEPFETVAANNGSYNIKSEVQCYDFSEKQFHMGDFLNNKNVEISQSLSVKDFNSYSSINIIKAS
ncbi:MAG: helix-turn-helix transcriptional regulator [Bacteroidales bacterium]|nr:helix-turn-helix transcriptional regulator [Bacteroidales bacterium]